MIRSFGDDETRKLFETGRSRRYSAFADIAMRKLAQLDAAHTLDFLRSPPGNRLEAKRAGITPKTLLGTFDLTTKHCMLYCGRTGWDAGKVQ